MKKTYSIIIGMLFLILTLAAIGNAAQTDITGPSGSGNFGQTVTVLPNGNIVVADTGYDAPGPINNVGAVHLYDGATLALISTLTGGAANDNVGNTITVLTNGNFVVTSFGWNGNRGAVTWCSAATGCAGVVSSANSLVGSTASDQVGGQGIIALTNGNYVVISSGWDNPSPAVLNVGAVTWGNGTTGTVGVVSSANSLIGSTAGDGVGISGVIALTNGNYVVSSPNWDNGAILNAGAATWGNGTTGISGTVSAANSLVGSTASDGVGSPGVTALTNGNYVVSSQNWDNGAISNAGAVTWGNGASGIVGAVSSANSLIGSTESDQVGIGVTALTNGNYVVRSPLWDDPSPLIINVGAATWGNGTSGTSGVVSSANSLIGGAVGDSVSSSGIAALTNGNYVVSSQNWDNPSPLIADVGAATWGNGTSGTSGVVSSANSLIGGTASDSVGSQGVVALTNGNYVVISRNWDNPSPAITDVGAVTWGNGTSGTSGTVSVSNSLIGTRANDQVGNAGVTALTNGNYVVRSSVLDDPSFFITNVGAATWGNGATGISGAVSAANSLVGSGTGDQVGSGGVTALTNGNYVVVSQIWFNPSLGVGTAGAVTWGNGTTGISGTVSAANSLVGSSISDQVGNGGVTALTNGNYVVRSQSWDIPPSSTTNVGAVTWGSGTSGVSGVISSANSLIGSTANDNVGSSGVTALTNGNYVVSSPNWDSPAPLVINASAYSFGNGVSGTSGAITSGASGGNSVVGITSSGTNTFAFDAARNRLVVGRQSSNTVSILSFTTTAIADGDLSNAANWSAGVPNGLVTGIIPSGRTMSISSVMNIGQIQVNCGGNLTGGSASAYIVGSVRKDFCAAANESFTYPIGDTSNYSPLNVSNANGTGNLTASVTDTFMPGLPATATSLSRYWSLEGTGITANLTFNYVDADVNGTESDYKIFRRPVNNNALVTQHAPSSVDTVNNTITAFNVSQFSDWGVGAQSLAPLAAGVSISGRVLTANGAGLRNAIVYLTKPSGETLTARTSSFGYYAFEDLEAGETYILSVASKRFTFTPQIVTANDGLTEVDFTALE